MTRRVPVALLLGLGLVSVVSVVSGCGARARPPADVAAIRLVALYRGRIELAGGPTRHFRMLLFAAAPDRIHAELLGPLGSPLLILDGGAGRLAATFVREKVAYVGRADRSTIGEILGVPIELADLVGAILDGEAADPGLTLVRSPDSAGTLPRALELRSAAAGLVLELKRRRPLAGAPAVLGRGEPPPGIPTRPIEELGEGPATGIFVEGEP